MKIGKRVITTLFLLFITVSITTTAKASDVETTAQNIIGRVIDAQTKEALIGAVISINDTGTKVVTDADGIFRISGVNTNKCKITVTYLAYRQISMDVTPLKSATDNDMITISLHPDEQNLEGVTITGVQKHNTEIAMVQLVKSSPVIVSNVSAQEIQRTQDNNAGEVIRRIPGVSIIEDKFVMVRGLSQRYNNVWINGGAVPSSEADTRSFSFDIIPSTQIDNMQIIKTPSPEYPADYSGGFIEINTKEIPSVNSFEISVGDNWNDQTVFRNFKYSKSSSTDWLGFDNGLRSLHGGIKSSLTALGNGIDLQNNHLNNDWYVKKFSPSGDMKFSANLGRRWYIGKNLLGMIAALNYTNEYRTNSDMTNNLYGAYDKTDDNKVYMHEYTDQQYNHNVRLGAMVNFTLLSPNGKNKYQFKNIFNQLGTSRYTWREGYGAQSDMENSAEYFYRSRSTYDGQITGKHNLKNDEITWSGSYAYANRNVPDRRRYTVNDRNETGVLSWYSSNDMSREWTKLDEHILSANVSDTHQFTFGNWMPTLKAGAYSEYRTRKYYTRQFYYNWDANNNTLPTGFESMNIPTLLSEKQYYGENKIYLLEEMQMRNNYKGNNTLYAGFMAVDLPLGNLNIYTGVRYEHNKMELISNTSDTKESPFSHYYTTSDFFPSINSTYKINDQNQMRFSYGKSINRPEFREVSSSVYYDFDLASDVQGNTTLKSCYVDNLDLRYEFYPSKSEIISLALFYKHFDSPIEWTYTVSGGTDLIYSYKNAKSADNYGLELDIKKDLSFIGLKDFSWSFNGSLINSKVKFAKGEKEENRPMQGQSKYLINSGIFYKNDKHDITISLLYNRIGKRLIGVGRSEGSDDKTARVPDSYEMPRNTVDFAASKKFGQHWEIKFNIRDLLAEKVSFKQFDAKADGKTIEEVTKEYKPGRNIGLNINYKF